MSYETIKGTFGGTIKVSQNKYCKIIIGEDKIFQIPIGDKSKLQIEGTAIKDLINEVKTMNEDPYDFKEVNYGEYTRR